MHIQEILAKLDSNIEDAEEDVDEDLDLDASQEEEAGKDQIIHGHQGGGDNDNMFNIYFDRAGWTAILILTQTTILHCYAITFSLQIHLSNC